MLYPPNSMTEVCWKKVPWNMQMTNKANLEKHYIPIFLHILSLYWLSPLCECKGGLITEVKTKKDWKDFKQFILQTIYGRIYNPHCSVQRSKGVKKSLQDNTCYWFFKNKLSPTLYFIIRKILKSMWASICLKQDNQLWEHTGSIFILFVTAIQKTEMGIWYDSRPLFTVSHIWLQVNRAFPLITAWQWLGLRTTQIQIWHRT